MYQQAELQGFLSIKIPPKIRGFLPWKTWKRQWISIRYLPAGGINLTVGRNSQYILHISSSDIIVRTHSRSHLYAFGIYPVEGTTANFCLAGTSETEAQKWISALRKLLRPPLLPVEKHEFAVSIIDNTFTRSSGFPGLYGILRVTHENITITDPFTSKIKAKWLWCQISHFYIPSTFNQEDRQRICTIVTSGEFPSGIGQIRLFCLDTLNLIQELTRGKFSNRISPYDSKRHFTFSHNIRNKETINGSMLCTQLSKRRTFPEALKFGRRLSKSEGNLMSLMNHFDNKSECSDSGFAQDFYNTLLLVCFSDRGLKSSAEAGESIEFRKTAQRNNRKESEISSDFKDADSSPLYQELDTDIDDEEPCFVNNRTTWQQVSPRRESGISIASGLYEEIDELSSCFTSGLKIVEEIDIEPPPPPLPPRRDSFHKSLKRNMYENVSTLALPRFPNKFLSRSAGNTPLPSPPSLSRSPSSVDVISSALQKDEESHYLPMNSCTKNLEILSKTDPFTNGSAEEQIYVVMSSFEKNQT